MLEHLDTVVFVLAAFTIVTQPFVTSNHPLLPLSTSKLPIHGKSTVTLLGRMSEDSKEDTSLSDLLIFIKQSEKNRKLEMKALEEKLMTFNFDYPTKVTDLTFCQVNSVTDLTWKSLTF